MRAMTDQGTGAGLRENVNDAYRYLMEVYEGPEAKRISLFGFSCGAFTARSLAGRLHKVGRPAPVHILWDTMESLALNVGKRWANTRLIPEIAFAYHALAIDERRKDFQPCLWDERNRRPGQTMQQVWFAGCADFGVRPTT